MESCYGQESDVGLTWKPQGEKSKIHKLRITLTSRKVFSRDGVSQKLIDRSNPKNLSVKCPVRVSS
jgi:hypothetical protein